MAKGQTQDFSAFWLILSVFIKISQQTKEFLVEVAMSATDIYIIQLVTEIKRNNAIHYHKYLIFVN